MGGDIVHHPNQIIINIYYLYVVKVLHKEYIFNFIKGINMAKQEQRSNKEAKKPKKDKVPANK